MEDKQIIDLFWERSETAVLQTEEKYGRYCLYIAESILGNAEDAKETVNDAMLKTWNSIPPNRPASFKSYVGMICRQTALDRYEKLHAEKRGGHLASVLDELTECVPDNASDTDLGESLALRDALDRFVRSLPRKAQAVFVRRYWYASPISEIAAEYSMNEGAVAALLSRTRKKLKHFLQKEGIYQV